MRGAGGGCMERLNARLSLGLSAGGRLGMVWVTGSAPSRAPRHPQPEPYTMRPAPCTCPCCHVAITTTPERSCSLPVTVISGREGSHTCGLCGRVRGYCKGGEELDGW